ncbi:hypothetical protein [Comamonas sp. GB3 AK4-5]|uniref:hypothetical protein n=1 Tax=Comamonas sp. GB3 AK4-5 TaxID=3231487 RepID=UPI00351E938F
MVASDQAQLSCLPSPQALLLRTPLAAQALAGRTAFTLRQRSVLLMAEGIPRRLLEALFHGQGAVLVQELLDAGYLMLLHPTYMDALHAADLHLARLRAQLQELCERLLHEQEDELAPLLRRLLSDAPDLPSLRAACSRWMQALIHQGGSRRIHCLRTQLQLLLAPPVELDDMESADDMPPPSPPHTR